MGGEVVICTPKLGPPSWYYLDSMLALRGATFRIARNDRPLAVDLARQIIAEKVMTEETYRNCEWLLWVDSDAEIHPDTVTRLQSWGQPIVAALAFTTGMPIVPTVYAGEPNTEGKVRVMCHSVHRWCEDHPQLHTDHAAMVEPRPADALQPVYFTGMHCTLVHRSVMERIRRPWFKGDLGGGIGEDRYFCEQARKAGIPVYVDRSVTAGHDPTGKRPLAVIDFAAYYAISRFEEGDLETEAAIEATFA